MTPKTMPAAERHMPAPHVGPAVAPTEPLVRVSRRSGVIGMLAASMLWGCSFTWVKAAGAGINASAGHAVTSPAGPIALLAWRFVLAALLWGLFHPRSLRGWTWRSAGRAALLGTALFVPMALQVLGLARTSEAVSAFLTSLTIVFVPLTLALLLRRPPRRDLWLAVALAACGIWLMTGAAPPGFGLGELFGLGCGVSFSAHILLLDAIMKRESFGRMTVGQFAFVGLAGLVTCALVPGGTEIIDIGGTRAALAHGWSAVDLGIADLLASRAVAVNLFLVTVVSTMGAFSLQFAFQPRITPTLAALILLAEPVFAAVFAYVMIGRELGSTVFIGAALILAANVYAILRDAGRA
jgi:drug/metabolite transporter (DMT)-like permease